MDMNVKFGEFIKAKRMQLNKSLRGMASDLGIAPSYMSDLENGKRNPPTGELLERFKEKLHLNPEEEYYFYELVGFGRGEVAPDMTEFLRRNDLIRELVRKFMDISYDVGDKLIDCEDEYIAILSEIEKIKSKLK